MRRLVLQLERDAQGAANWQFGPSPGEPAAPTPPPRIDTLVVESGTIRLNDALQRVMLEMTLSNREGSGTAGPAGGLQVRGRGTYRGAPLQARVSAAGLLPLVAGGPDSAPVPFRLDLALGRLQLDLEGRVRGLWRLAGLDGRFRLTGPSLAAVGDALDLTLPSTAAFVAQGQLSKDGTDWRARVEHFSVGSSRLNGDFRYAAATSPGQLSGTLGGERLVLQDLGPAFGASPGPEAPRPDGRVLPRREFDLPSLGRMQAQVTVRLDRLDPGTPQLAPLTPLQAVVVLRDQVLSVRELLARSAGGEVSGAVTLDARTGQPRWQGDLHWSGLRLERLIQARNPRAQRAAGAGAGTFVGGLLSGQARVQGRGRSTAAMLASLDGSVNLWVRDGHLSHLVVELLGIDLAESLGLLLRGDAPLPMRCAVAQMQARDGRLQVTTGVLDTPDTTLLIGGELSLAQERLALRVRARPRDFSPLALRAPLRVEGSFAQPQVRLDAGSIGTRVAAAVGLGAAAPLAGLLALMDLGEPERQACEQAWQRLQDPPTAGRARR
jgi:uncharacterized protein involved in outer membrane biogenesis